jgi:hypothetical protein
VCCRDFRDDRDGVDSVLDKICRRYPWLELISNRGPAKRIKAGGVFDLGRGQNGLAPESPKMLGFEERLAFGRDATVIASRFRRL